MEDFVKNYGGWIFGLISLIVALIKSFPEFFQIKANSKKLNTEANIQDKKFWIEQADRERKRADEAEMRAEEYKKIILSLETKLENIEEELRSLRIDFNIYKIKNNDNSSNTNSIK